VAGLAATGGSLAARGDNIISQLSLAVKVTDRPTQTTLYRSRKAPVIYTRGSTGSCSAVISCRPESDDGPGAIVLFHDPITRPVVVRRSPGIGNDWTLDAGTINSYY